MADGRIFISYRRGVDNGEARSLYYQLERFFARERLFMDVDDIPVGADFVEYLDSQVAQCQALIAVIGRGWVADSGRLHSDEDFVRIEIDAALKRGAQVPIIPLLIDDSVLPARDDLPEVLHPLRRRHGVAIRHESYASTIEARLIPALSKALHEDQAPKRRAPQPELAEVAAPVVGAPAVEKPALPDPGTIFKDVPAETWCPEMVVIPTGEFMMGSPEDEEGRYEDEGPQHEVEISQPFALARYATTFEEYDAFCDDTGAEKPDDEGWGRGRRPAINISWLDARTYCDWLTEKTGQPYRLPSEAEWEYACRAGTTTAFSFGGGISGDTANFGSDRGRTLAVDYRGFQPNAFKLHQMHGNVREWCADDVADSYETPRRQSPLVFGPRGNSRVLRGGGWSEDPGEARSADRDGDGPDARDNEIGFRPARTLTP